MVGVKRHEFKEETMFIHAADIHLGFKQYGSDQREQDFFDTFLKFAERVRDLKPDFTIIAGDLFNSRNINPHVFSRASEILDVIPGPIVCVEGNHDRQLAESFTWMQFLAQQGKIILLSPRWKDDPFAEYDGERGFWVKIGDQVVKGMKYMGSSTKESLKRLPLEEDDILILHTGVVGIDIHVPAFVTKDDLISLPPKYIALGHFHKPFALGKKVYNPGSLETNSFRETHEKGFIINDGTVRRETIKTRPFVDKEVYVTGLETVDELEGALMFDHPGAVVQIKIRGVMEIDRNLFSFKELQENKGDALIFRIVDQSYAPSQRTVVVDAQSRDDIEWEVFKQLAGDEGLAKFALELMEFLKGKPEPDQVIERMTKYAVESDLIPSKGG